MNLKKINICFLVVALICATLVPAASFAGESNAAESIAPDYVHIIGSHSIWRHSDGKTWQTSGKPGDTKSTTVTYPFQPKGEIESITAIYFPEKTDSDGDWTIPAAAFHDYSVTELSVTKSSGVDLYNNGQLSIPITYKLYAIEEGWQTDEIKHHGFDITEYDWQGKLVRGYEYYLPIKVTVTYKSEVPQEVTDGAITTDPSITSEAGIEEITPSAIVNTPVGECAEKIPFNVGHKTHTVYCSGCKKDEDGDRYCPGHICTHSASYEAKLTVGGTLNAVHPNGNSTTFKSGYGFTISANSTITVTKVKESCTNPRGACGGVELYDNTNHGATISAPNQGEVRTTATYNQKGWVVKNEDIKRLFKKSNYTQPRVIALEKVNAGSLSSSFKTAYNKASNFYYEKGKLEQSRVIYTDVALSGTREKPQKHSIDIYLCGGGVTYNGAKVGTFCGTCNKVFTINGNMHEDHRVVTGSGRS